MANEIVRSSAFGSDDSDCDPVHAFRLLGLTPDPWQRDVLRSRAQRILLNCSRQAGKTTVAAALAIRETLFVPNGSVLIISASERQSAEVLRVVTQGLDAVGPCYKTRTSTEVEIEGAGRVISLPCREATARGFVGSLLIIDEAARVPDEVYEAVSPSLGARNGRTVCLSTPCGRRGFFYQFWIDDDPDSLKISVPATQVSRLSPAFLARKRRELGEQAFAQEFLCQFRSYAGAVYPTFDHCVVNEAPRSVGPRWGGIDFGFRSPAAIIEGFWAPDGRFVVDYEFYQPGLSAIELAPYLSKKAFYFADSAEPSSLKQLRKLDIKVTEANKAFMTGVGTLTRLINTGQLVVVASRCPNLLREAQELVYRTPKNGEPTESDTEGPDHALDALRYLAMGIQARRRTWDWRDPRNHVPSDRVFPDERSGEGRAPASAGPPSAPTPKKQKWLSIYNEALWTRLE
jgi:Terminase large subunit, T4likevirus-type, N-terminal